MTCVIWHPIQIWTFCIANVLARWWVRVHFCYWIHNTNDPSCLAHDSGLINVRQTL